MIDIDKICIYLPDFSIENISFTIAKGEYHVLLGPSGSGKTLILNAIAGLKSINAGQIIYKGNNITKLAPNKRNIPFLFQDLALFPHLNVFDNIAFPLNIKKINKKVIEQRVDDLLDFVGITALKNRRIDKLSGGEKQRVAIARCLILESEVILLDEPFSAIDTQLLLELKKLLKKISSSGVTVVHVTHNFEEAVNLADKITVIDKGRIIQSGLTEQVFNNPANSFIAAFSGKRNYFACKNYFVSDGNYFVQLVNDVILEIPQVNEKISGIIIDSSHIILSETKIISSARNSFSGTIKSFFKSFSGYDIEVDIGISLWISITSHSYSELNIEKNKCVWISFKASAIKIIC